MHPFRFTVPVCLRACAVLLTLLCAQAHAQSEPVSVTVVGTFQSELGCAGDWDPACSNTALERNAVDGVWRKLFTVPGGSQEFKVAINASWEENYGANGLRNGPNLQFSHTEESIAVKFYYDPVTHWVTNSTLTPIAVIAGSLQTEVGCPTDWEPKCMLTWLKDVDGDGTQELRIPSLPAGSYELKVAHHEGWDENYGQGGEPGGANIPLTVPAEGQAIRFSYESWTHLLTIHVAAPTTTVLDVSPNPSPIAGDVTLTAHVSVTEGVAMPTGSVTFRVDGAELGTAPVGANGVATLTTSPTVVGTFSFTAEYNGVYETSVSVPVVVNTAHRTTTALTVSPAGATTYGAQLTLNATVATVDASVGPASGEVVFRDGEATLGTVQVDAQGHASLSLTTLAVGQHALSASFVPQGQFLSSRGEASHTVNPAEAQVTLESSQNPSLIGQSVTFTARVSSSVGAPGGSITILEGKNELATVNLNAQGEASYMTSALTVGEHSLTAAYSGDEHFASSTSTALTQVVKTQETPDAGTGDQDGGSAPDSGTSSDGGTTESDAGTGSTDAGTGGGTDAGPGDTDAGSGGTDAGPGDTDAGSGNTDAGTSTTDAGAGDTDAGTTPGNDAGTQVPDAGSGNPDDMTDESGCGCGAGAGGSSPLFLLGMWMGLTALQSRRRARR